LEESLVQKLNSSDDITAPPNLIRREACVRSGAPWKKYFSKGKGPSLEGTNGYVEEETADEAAGTMHRFRDELFDLWNNAAIRKALRQRRVRIEDESGLYVSLHTLKTIRRTHLVGAQASSAIFIGSPTPLM
jgi:hypothetical protein